MQGKQEQNNDSVRQAYVAPQVTEFGRVRDLTAGGSGEKGEANPSNKFKRP